MIVDKENEGLDDVVKGPSGSWWKGIILQIFQASWSCPAFSLSPDSDKLHAKDEQVVMAKQIRNRWAADTLEKADREWMKNTK